MMTPPSIERAMKNAMHAKQIKEEAAKELVITKHSRLLDMTCTRCGCEFKIPAAACDTHSEYVRYWTYYIIPHTKQVRVYSFNCPECSYSVNYKNPNEE